MHAGWRSSASRFLAIECMDADWMLGAARILIGRLQRLAAVLMREALANGSARRIRSVRAVPASFRI